MIPSIGFAEMLLLAVLALIFVGPKDLPAMMRTLGQWVGRLKSMTQEFKDAFDDMGRETELAELRKEIDELKSLGSSETILGSIDKDLDGEMRALDSDLRAGVDMTHPRMTPKPPAPKIGGDDG